MLRILLPDPPCPVCTGHTVPHDVVDFHKSCVEQEGRFLSHSGIPIYYFVCESCGFLFAPEFSSWPPQEFAKYIYNAQYVEMDPDYTGKRPRANAEGLLKVFPDATAIRHLDYGGGSGILSQTLAAGGWNSDTYDPFADRGIPLSERGRFNLITSFEVFEHEPNVRKLVETLRDSVTDDGIILFSTLLSDNYIRRHERINWWYVAPRNGHISIFSRSALENLAAYAGFRLHSISEVLHIFWRTRPEWATNILPAFA